MAILQYLDTIHHDRCRGFEDRVKAHQDVLPHARTLYRHERRAGHDLVYFPRIRYAALGRRLVHFVLRNPTNDWRRFPLATQAIWLSPLDGDHVLLLPSLVPMGSEGPICNAVRRLVNAGWADRLTVVPTGDGWQHARRFSTWTGTCGCLAPTTGEHVPATMLRASLEDESLLHRFWPFSIPVVCEQLEHRASLERVWHDVCERLGRDVWAYLPRKRRLPRNGKIYVKQTLSLLERLGVFRQNVVRYKPLLRKGIEVYLLIPALAPEPLAALMDDLLVVCPDVEVYPAFEERTLLRAFGDHAMIDRLIAILPSHRPVDLFVGDKSHEPLEVRFAYEQFFDPKTRTWNVEEDALVAELLGRQV